MSKKLRRIILAALGIGAVIVVAASPVSAAVPAGGNYAALGDSVAAGVGLAPSMIPTEEDLLCGRTTQAYPRLLAADLGLNLTTAACSGAQASDLYNSQDVQGTNLLPQIDAAFANGTPDVITLTVGANDLHWNDFVHFCYIAQCGGESSDWAAKAGRAYLRSELFWAFAKIDRLSGHHPPKVIVTGYFTPFSTTQCADTQGLSGSEIAWLNSQAAQLNRAIYSVTAWFPFTTYVPVDFTGHGLCASDSWVQGLTAPAPFHPTAAGQQAIAGAIRSSL